MHYRFFIWLMLLVGSLACKKIHTARPNCTTAYVDIPQDTSYLSTPLVIPTQLIEDKLNLAVGQDIMNDDDFESINTKGKKDKLKLKITRLGDIQITWKNNVARYQTPVVVLIEREIVNKHTLPLLKSLALKTKFSLRIIFETTIDIGTDWKLETSTKFVSFEWLSEVKTLGGLIDLKKLIERRLIRKMPQILIKMDDQIRSTVHIDRMVGRIWQKIQKPVIIHRKVGLVWLKINPIQFELGTITTENHNLLIQGRLSATTQTLFGKNPAYEVDTILPPLVKRKELTDEAYIYMLSEISYTDINILLNRALKGKVLIISGHRIKVTEAEAWGCGSNLNLRLKIKGAVRGDIYFQGVPRYEADSQQIVIQHFDFEVVTEEALLASADWLLHSSFKDQIQQALSIQLGDKIAKIPEAIMAGIENGKVGTKLDLCIEQWDFQPKQLLIRPDDIAILITVKAKASIQLEKI